jgi:hypothetical protein
MSVRSARRLLFLAVVLVVPLPMLGPFDALVPPVRYIILSSAGLAVATVEGAAGPVPMILMLFAAHAVVYLVLAWLTAWIAARLLAVLSPRARRNTVLATCAAMLFVALATRFYRTPFGRSHMSNLLGVLS